MSRKNTVFKLSKYVQVKIVSLLWIKDKITFWILGAFLECFLCKNRVRSKVKEAESKYNVAYHGAINSGLLNPQKVWFHEFPVLWSFATKDISRKFKATFSSLAAFRGITPIFKKKIGFSSWYRIWIDFNLSKVAKIKNKEARMLFSISCFSSWDQFN